MKTVMKATDAKTVREVMVASALIAFEEICKPAPIPEVWDDCWYMLVENMNDPERIELNRRIAELP